MKGLFMASEVRSGSTYIAEVISYSLHQSFGVECWNLAEEKFAPVFPDGNASDINAIYHDLFINQLGFRCSKIMTKELSLIYRRHEEGSFKENLFGDGFLWLIVRRKNIFRQAVSLAFAKSSGLYHYYGQPEFSIDANVMPSLAEIKEAHMSLLASSDYLELFSGRVCNSVTIFYEDFLDDPQRYCRKIVRALKIGLNPLKLRVASPKLVPTSQDHKALAEEKYKEYFMSNF